MSKVLKTICLVLIVALTGLLSGCQGHYQKIKNEKMQSLLDDFRNTDKKFELTSETVAFQDLTLHRIKALKDFSNVKSGDLGGFVEKENNLSHKGNCWIYDNSKVCCGSLVAQNSAVVENSTVNNALVCENAIVRESTVKDVGVCGNAKITRANLTGYGMVSRNVTGNSNNDPDTLGNVAKGTGEVAKTAAVVAIAIPLIPIAIIHDLIVWPFGGEGILFY